MVQYLLLRPGEFAVAQGPGVVPWRTATLRRAGASRRQRASGLHWMVCRFGTVQRLTVRYPAVLWAISWDSTNMVAVLEDPFELHLANNEINKRMASP